MNFFRQLPGSRTGFFICACFFLANALSAWSPPAKKRTKEELKKSLSAMQYNVSQEEGTEPPFKNEYWDNHRDGIYVDVIYGEPLFSSQDKYESGTGWPSFSKPLDKKFITTKIDKGFFTTRTEVRSQYGDLHLGHVFDDGPKPTGLRYCMNSASMKFIPKEDLEKSGYGEYAKLFAATAAAASPKPTESKVRVPFKYATFAGGCFWCMEPPFEKLPGVTEVISGYSGGNERDPTYEDVSAGATGHAEVVRITYDPNRIHYNKLLEVFWHQINPTTPNRQFVDVGAQYRTAIFYHDEEQRKLAEKSREALDKSNIFGAKIVTEITKAGMFYPAEDYHQDYYKENPIRYKYYRYRSGRDQYLDKLWGKGNH